MLLAIATRPAPRHHHPNLPLEAEMGSMGSNLGSLEGAMRPHEVARAAARQLGVEGQIQFVKAVSRLAILFHRSEAIPECASRCSGRRFAPSAGRLI